MVNSQEFTQQITKEYHTFLKGWLTLSPHDIIEHSAEIAATRQCYSELVNMGLEDEQISRLLDISNPLDAVRNQYLHLTNERLYASVEGTNNTRLAVEAICEAQERQTMSGCCKGVTMC